MAECFCCPCPRVNSLYPIYPHILSFLPSKQWLSSFHSNDSEGSNSCTNNRGQRFSTSVQTLGVPGSQNEAIWAGKGLQWILLFPGKKSPALKCFSNWTCPCSQGHHCQPSRGCPLCFGLLSSATAVLSYLRSFLLHCIQCMHCCQPQILFPSCHFLAREWIASVPHPFYLFNLSLLGWPFLLTVQIGGNSFP